MNTKMMIPLGNRLLATAFCAVIASGFAQVARAANLVQDGTFVATPGTGQIGFSTSLTYWQTPPNTYDFLFQPLSPTLSTADSGGALGQFGNVQLWGPGNGVANGLPGTDPAGGNFVALDSAFEIGALSQMITGLTAGDTYALSFYFAGAQQAGKTGPTGDMLSVSLGSATQYTASNSVPSEGFSPWTLETLDYTATSSSELLSFLASGGPSGSVPPFALLGGVTLSQITTPPSVPDRTSTAALLGFALVVVGYAGRRGGWARRH
jgi:hypothetical protein